MAQRSFFGYSIKRNLVRYNVSVSPATVATSETPRILLVDDDEDAVSSRIIVLGMRGDIVRTVMNGLDVIAARADFEPHVIVLGISLPNVDGYEVRRRIRKEAGARHCLASRAAAGVMIGIRCLHAWLDSSANSNSRLIRTTACV